MLENNEPMYTADIKVLLSNIYFLKKNFIQNLLLQKDIFTCIFEKKGFDCVFWEKFSEAFAFY